MDRNIPMLKVLTQFPQLKKQRIQETSKEISKKTVGHVYPLCFTNTHFLLEGF